MNNKNYSDILKKQENNSNTLQTNIIFGIKVVTCYTETKKNVTRRFIYLDLKCV